MELVVGVDVHKLEHVAAAIDGTGRSRGQLTFKNTGRGFDRLLSWLKGLGAEHIVIGIENAGGYGATLTVALARCGFDALDVPPWRTAPERRALGPAKTDPRTPRPSRVSLLVTELGWRLRCSPNSSERSAYGRPPVAKRSATAQGRSCACGPMGSVDPAAEALASKHQVRPASCAGCGA